MSKRILLAVAQLLRRLADKIDPPRPSPPTTDGSGGPGPFPP